ncbi:MAG: hypothetical protein E6J68_00270 [Deltaproteobacteria bacterium]|nr:MAG: hypothetical protein E6J68_00270 [Deltaproteobacteria bacterium]
MVPFSLEMLPLTRDDWREFIHDRRNRLHALLFRTSSARELAEHVRERARLIKEQARRTRESPERARGAPGGGAPRYPDSPPQINLTDIATAFRAPGGCPPGR